MKIARLDKNHVGLDLRVREKDLLFGLLKRYPRVPLKHFRLSRIGGVPDQPSAEKLLDESFVEQRAANLKALAELLTDASRLQRLEHGGCRLRISDSELEWLLQMLNDVRVGSWVRLGCKEQKDLTLDETTAAEIWAMEVTGAFQMAILEALEQNPLA